jgi:hypothetical protein
MARSNTRASGLCCSFCHKSQESVAKLISSPSDYQRAYICDECITVCNSILEDDRGQLPPVSEMPVNPSEKHPLLAHPLASSLLTAIGQWVRRESSGSDAALELSEVHKIAAEHGGEIPAGHYKPLLRPQGNSLRVFCARFGSAAMCQYRGSCDRFVEF